MKLTDLLRKAGKVAVSAMLALAALSLLCTFYYNFADYAKCEDGVTDFCREPNAFYCGAVEGFVWGKTNNEGYLNLYDYTPGMEINILVFGSSQMEANQVLTKNSCSVLLADRLPGKRVYSAGMSSHRFLTCADNYSAAVNKYNPTDYIIFETAEVDFPENEMADFLSGNQPDLYDYVNKNNFLGYKNNGIRLANSQFHSFWDVSGTKKLLDGTKTLLKNIKNGKSIIPAKSGEQNSSQEVQAPEMASESEIEQVISRLVAQTTSACGAKLIILYLPKTAIMPDGSMEVYTSENIGTFESICEKYGITLVDMSERFDYEYRTNHLVPYGFTNTPVSSGHLNRYGHAMIADTLYNVIGEVSR
ncbi:MAG: hypothetical protein IJL87_04185 [Clostridia bacterium]|nr:hypothetical protein [Clostridia bacterium]